MWGRWRTSWTADLEAQERMSNEGVPVCGNQDEEQRLSSCENTDPNRKESSGGGGSLGLAGG